MDLLLRRLTIGAQICKTLESPGINSRDSIPLAFVAWRAGTTALFLIGP